MCNRPFLLLIPAFLLGIFSCIPDSTNNVTVERREVRIDTVRISWSKDTVSVTDSAWGNRLVAIYHTGASDCFEYDTSAVVRSADTFFVRIWENARIGRVCLDTKVRETRVLELPGTFLPATYTVIANHFLGDTVAYQFLVTP